MNTENLSFKPLHYYKCLDCLTPVSTEERSSEDLFCDCGGFESFEYMGRVHQNSIVKTEKQCKCSEICAHASGPNCTCECGGLNHGHGVKAYIMVDKVTGKITRRSKVKPKNMAHAIWYRKTIELLQQPEIYGKYKEMATQRFVGDWQAYRAINKIQYLRSAFKKAKTVKKRTLLWEEIQKINGSQEAV